MVSFLPIPVAPRSEVELLDWAQRLVAYLKGQKEPESTLEADLVFGGADVASRIFGFEGEMVAPAPLATTEMVAAPTGAKKRVITSLTISSSGGTAQSFRIYKLKIAVQTDVIVGQVQLTAPFTAMVNCQITLDAADESLRLEATTGTIDLHYDGSYIDLD